VRITLDADPADGEVVVPDVLFATDASAWLTPRVASADTARPAAGDRDRPQCP
jgi:hypothetical protein